MSKIDKYRMKTDISEFIERKQRERDRRGKRRKSKDKKREWLYAKG